MRVLVVEDERNLAEARRLRPLGVLEPVGLAGVLDVVHGRTAGLDRDQRLDQVRPRIGDGPTESTRLRMRQQDCRKRYSN